MFEHLFAKRGLSLDRMRVLLEVREAGSIVLAAGADPARQSQYSRQLKELDEFFGVPLTQRKGRTLSLTPVGEELAVLIKEHFVALGALSRRIESQPIPVFIGAGESLIHWLLMPLANDLQRAVPDIALRFVNLTSTSISRRLEDRDLDIGLLRSNAVSPTTEKRPLGCLAHLLFVPKHLLALAGGKRDASLLARLPIANYPGETSIGRALHQHAGKAGVRINVRVECETGTGLAQAVLSREFAAVLPDLAASHLGKDVVGIRLPLLKSISREISIAWKKRKAGVRPELEKVQRWLTANATLPRQSSSPDGA